MPEIKVIFWDFDGVILDSNTVRDQGFEKVLEDYPLSKVNDLIAFHQANGGLSRYVKFRYFFEEILQEELTEKRLSELCDAFSQIMRSLLTNERLLIQPMVDFIKKHSSQYIMHIVSGSDQEELRYLCQTLDIAKYFKSIHGSPTPKMTLVQNLITEHEYNIQECVLIGDSINDFEAAQANNIGFIGYNNAAVEQLTTTSTKLF